MQQSQPKEILPSVGLSGSKSIGRKRKTEIATCIKQVVSTPEFQVDLVRLLCNIVYPKKVGVLGRKDAGRILHQSTLELACK